MRTTMIFLALALGVAGAAQAQIKCWTGADGRRTCGDTPPPGAKVTTVRTPAAPAAPAAPPGPGAKGAGAKDAKKGPLTPAEREQEFRKRQQEQQEAAAKAQKEQQDAAVKRDNCARARESLGMLESGQRVARTNAQGERYYIDDAQREQEAASARQAVKEWCN